MIPAGVHTLPPGVDFPAELVAGLCGHLKGSPPEAMARVTVYLNTARMLMRVREAFIRRAPVLLPRLRLITALADDPALGLPAATPPLRRRLELARLVSGLLHAQPDLAPRSAVFDLADSLAALMDEMQSEGVGIDRLMGLDVSNHSAHWARVQTFFRIIAPQLTDDTSPDPGALQRLAVERLIARWQAAPPADPVIVAGSTGSRGMTARLMAAVARLPNGTVVLPGFDGNLPPDAWEAMDDILTSEDHPQFRYRQLARQLNCSPLDFRCWNMALPPAPDRNRLISLSLRPAPVTDRWLAEGPGLPDLIGATQEMTLIEAPTPRVEALAIALILREAAETGTRAALITPDRTLARHVTAALDRWQILPDDSAGRPLALSAPGRFLRHVADLFCTRLTADRLLILLKHPLTASGDGRGLHALLSRELERRLRRHGPAFPTPDDLVHWAASSGIEGAADWAARLSGILGAAADTGGLLPLADHVARHRTIAEELARGSAAEGSGGLWDKATGQAALQLIGELAAEAAHGGEMTAVEYRDLFQALLARGEVRETVQSHPQILIWGTVEARMQDAGLVILGGLNDGVWPQLPDPDPWLNRALRKEAGLLLPERRIGLSAHDYQQAVAAPRVVLSRAARDAEAECVPSRWLNRLTNLIGGLKAQGGEAALAAMRARGNRWLSLAERFEADLRAVPAASALRNPRPAPAPPASARLNTLPVTRIEKLIRDPYHIYAERILRLAPLNPLAPEPDARLRGTVLHRVPDAYVQAHPPGTPGDLAAFLAIAETILAQECPWIATRLHWLARLHRTARAFVDWNAGLDAQPVLTERKGALTLGGFTLTGQPDRIDRAADGRLRLYDYKTGTLPSTKQIEFYNKQLVLLAIMASEDAFGLGPAEVESATFIGLGSKFDSRAAPVAPGDLLAERARLLKLIAAYQDPDQGFTALRAVAEERQTGDYDALARRGEWEAGDAAVTIRVGDADG